MAAEPTPAQVPPRSGATRCRPATMRRPLARVGLAVAVSTAVAAPAHAEAPAIDAALAAVPLLSKPPAPAKRPAPTHAWTDGGTVRALTLEPRLHADFSPGPGGRRAVLRESAGPLAHVSPALQSPVLRDESGRARALPGGVVVTLAAGLSADDGAARALLARHGATSARRLASGAWLVETPAGLASLETAERLARTGAFASAQPNWWVERTLK